MNGKLQFEVELDKKNYKIDESITIKCKIKNIGDESVNLMPTFLNDAIIYLKYEGEDSVTSYGLKILPRVLIKKEDIINLLPGQAHPFDIVFSKDAYIMPDKLDHYELYLMYESLVPELEEIKLWTGEIKSNIVSFELTK